MTDTTKLELHCDLTVNEVIAEWPATAAVFNRFGIDTCCGGGMKVGEAAHHERVDPVILCEAVHAVAEQAA